jgi:hypothetical protein
MHNSLLNFRSVFFETPCKGGFSFSAKCRTIDFLRSLSFEMYMESTTANEICSAWLFVFQKKAIAKSLPRNILHRMEIRLKGHFPLGGIFCAERNFSLSFLISSTREITRQRKIPLRAHYMESFQPGLSFILKDKILLKHSKRLHEKTEHL